MTKIRVGVMRGGPGSEYHISLRTGGNVLAALSRDKYEPHDILVTNKGEWNIDGVPIHPSKLNQQVDVVFNALHGEFGEDGKVQNILDFFNIPYTGSTVLTSAIGMNKDLAKKHFSKAGIKVPRGIVVLRGEEIDVVIERVKLGVKPPYVVKPLNGGSSIGLSLARNEKELIAAIEHALMYGGEAIVEEYVHGREIMVGVINAVDGERAYAMAPLEILMPEGVLYDYTQKYTNPTYPIGLARMRDDERHELEHAALHAHSSLGVRHYATYDFILGDEGPCLLEVNTLPGLTNTSLFPKALAHFGLPLPEFVDFVIDLALGRK